jgi:hypothetical protein
MNAEDLDHHRADDDGMPRPVEAEPAFTVDQIRDACLQYDLEAGEYPEHMYEGFPVGEWIVRRLAGHPVKVGEMDYLDYDGRETVIRARRRGAVE